MTKLNLVIFLCILILTSCDSNSQVLNSNPGFENGTWKKEWRLHPQNSSDAIIDVVTNPTRNGKYALHMKHQKKGNGISNRCEIGCETYISKKTPRGGYIRWHEEVWIGFSVYLKDWDKNLGTWNGIMQVHSIPGNRDWSVLASANAWHIKGNDGFFSYSSVGQPNIFIDTRPIKDPYMKYAPDAERIKKPIWWMPIEEASNKWVDFVGNFVISPDDDGKMKWWVNGKLVIDFKGPNIYFNDTEGNPAVKEVILQTGSYKSPQSTNMIEMYLDEIRLGNKDASYEDVAPRDDP